MKDKLCIILKSTYSSGLKEHIKWNAEVLEDSKTVHETLGEDHDIIEIELLATEKAKQKIISETIKEVFSQMTSHYTACHIVLNTHGAAGRSDLSDTGVKEVVQNASNKKIKVSQVSALLCNGMKPLCLKKQEVPVLGLAQSLTRSRESCMSILQQKLKSLTTKIPQNFPIWGFMNAYDSIDDKEKVISILQGNGEALLQVTTALPQTAECYIKLINKNIEMIKDDAPNPAAESVLGAALDDMKRNIYDFLNGVAELKAENAPLLVSLKIYASKNYDDKSDVYLKNNFKKIYEAWKKTHKVKSDERLKIFKEHCCILNGVNYPTDSIAPGTRINSDKDFSINPIELITTSTWVENSLSDSLDSNREQDSSLSSSFFSTPSKSPRSSFYLANNKGEIEPEIELFSSTSAQTI